MALPTEFYVYVGYGLFAMVVVVAIVNFLLGGLLGPFMKVKRSRGKMVLVKIRNPIQDFFIAGHIEEGFLIFKDRLKNTRRIQMMPGVVSRAATINWVEIDDEKNCFFKRDTGAAVSTYDPVKVDSLLVRAMMKPGVVDTLLKIVLVLVIITFVAVLGVGFIAYKNGVALEALQAGLRVASDGVGVVP